MCEGVWCGCVVWVNGWMGKISVRWGACPFFFYLCFWGGGFFYFFSRTIRVGTFLGFEFGEWQEGERERESPMNNLS